MEILAQPRFVLAPDRINIGALPEWIHEDPRAEFLLHANDAEIMNLADKHALERLIQGIARHPWVKTVSSAEKHFPGEVNVSLEWRKPVAMVRVKDGLLPVDREGVLLPTRDFTPLEAARYPRIEGINPEQVNRLAGQIWNDPVVQHGALLADCLLDRWARYQFRSLCPTSVTAHSSSPEFEIHTRKGSRIIWGAVVKHSGGETPDDTTLRKLQWLEAYYREHGSFEGLDGPQIIDLRPPQPTVRPLAEKK